MKYLLSTTLAFLLSLTLLVSGTHAQSIDTIIKGTVRDTSNQVIDGASVTVSCNGINRNTTTNSAGDYLVTYSSSECAQGDSATAAASASEGSGSNSGTVQRFTAVNGLELDIAIIDIVAVPELGMITGIVSALGSGVAFLGMRKRFV